MSVMIPTSHSDLSLMNESFDDFATWIKRGFFFYSLVSREHICPLVVRPFVQDTSQLEENTMVKVRAPLVENYE